MEAVYQDKLGSIVEPAEHSSSMRLCQSDFSKPQPMAFTIHFAESKAPISPRKLQDGFLRHAARHMRNSSLPNVDESKKGVSPLPVRKGLMTRKAGYNSEGYFSSDQEEDIRNRSDFFVKKLKSMDKAGIRTTNLAQGKKIMAEQSSEMKRDNKPPDVEKQEFGDFIEECNGEQDGVCYSRVEGEALDIEDVEDSSNDTVSEAGTYTIERDTPCPEVIRARQDIENVILRVGRMTASAEANGECGFKMSLYRDDSNWINEWASHVAKHNHESGFDKALPPLPVGKQQGPTPVSTSKIPSPVHQNVMSPTSRKHTLSGHSLHEPLLVGDTGAVERHSDSSLETESFLRTTESVVTAMQARMCLSMDSGGESDVDTSHSYQGPGDRYLVFRRLSNASDSSARQEGHTIHSDSSSEAGEAKLKKKELAGPAAPQMRYNRAFSLRRARLDCENESLSDKKKKTVVHQEVTHPVSNKLKKVTDSAKPSTFRGSKSKSPKPEAFSRTDSGRLSTRITKPASQLPQTPKMGNTKKDMKKSPGGRSNSTLSSREVEFQNWKRRKSYDPMKAAAEGKRKEAAKKATMSTSMTQSSIVDPSHQNPVLRSASFHGTGGMTPNYVSSEDEVTLSADEDSPLSGCPPPLLSASPSKVVVEGAFGGSRVSLHSTASNSSLRGRAKMEALDSLVMAAVCGLSKKLRGSSCKLLKKLKYLYEDDSERCEKLNDVIELLENTAPPGSPQTKSPSKELSGTLKNLKTIESVFKVLDDILFDEEDFDLEVASYQ